jgi:hypothetical protein
MERQRQSLSIAPHLMQPGLSHAEAVSRCLGAAKLALRGDRWGYTFQIDCAADIMAEVAAESLRNPRRGRPQDVLRGARSGPRAACPGRGARRGWPPRLVRAGQRGPR